MDRSFFMEFQTYVKDCHGFSGAVNIGYVRNNDQGLLIDAGIDKSTMKKVIKRLEQDDLPLTHLFITHAHADHYGGAHYLQQQKSIYTIAPILEEAILRNPILEPLYLFAGNDPLPELRNKFLEGNPIQVNQVIDEGHHQVGEFNFETLLLPGHSYHQLALKIEGVLYAGDSYFGADQLEKHKIPYITDADLTIKSLLRLKEIHCIGAIPGHGEFEIEFHETIDANIRYHENLLTWLDEEISKYPNGISHETIVANMCEYYQVNAKQLSQWLLFRTAITSYLVCLIKQGKITHDVKQGKWMFCSLT